MFAKYLKNIETFKTKKLVIQFLIYAEWKMTNWTFFFNETRVRKREQ